MDQKTEHYIARAILAHNGKYDYSLIHKWDHYEMEGTIICPFHGEFIQTVRTHIQKQCGCPKCGRSIVGQMNAISYEEFIYRAQLLHGDVYDYSHITNYINNTTKVVIGCKIHGLFSQSPTKHINGRGTGCPKCAGKNMTTQDFISRSQEKHGIRYDYSQVLYIQSRKKVRIGCSIHGAFDQSPNGHLQGYGCKRCAEDENPGVYSELYFRTHPEVSQIIGTLYLIRFVGKDSNFLKIGITKHLSVRKRIGVGFAGYHTEVVSSVQGALLTLFRSEQSLHQTLVEYRYHDPIGLKNRGGTECFIDVPHVVQTVDLVVQSLSYTLTKKEIC